MVKPIDPDQHSFNVAANAGTMRISCRLCKWQTSYPIGDEAEYQRAKNEAVAHRESTGGESEVERYRR